MNNIKALKNTLKKAPLSKNNPIVQNEWESVVDNILASKPVTLNSYKEVSSNVVHLDPITVPEGASINWLSTHISKDVTYATLPSGFAPAVGIRISLNEPIETKANADTWLIPNVVLKVENGIPDLTATSLPITSSECHFIYNNGEPPLKGFTGGSEIAQTIQSYVGNLTGSIIHPPLWAISSDSYTSESINADKIFRGTQIISGPEFDHRRAYSFRWSYYSGSIASVQENIQSPFLLYRGNLGIGNEPVRLQSMNFAGNNLFEPNTNEAVIKNVIESTSNSWDLRTFNSETKIYMSLYFFYYDKTEYTNGVSSAGTLSRFASEVDNGTVGAFLNTTPLTIETPGEVTFTATIINNKK